jgi:hypothetical protein
MRTPVRKNWHQKAGAFPIDAQSEMLIEENKK